MQNNRWIIFVILSAFVLRLPALNQSLWLDEGIVVQSVRSYGLLELITKHMVGEFHPPLYYMLMWVWVRIFGVSEIALRMPSVLFNMGLIFIIYDLVKSRLKDTRLLRFFLLFFITSPLLFYYAQEARMYMLAAFLVSWSMWSFWRWMEGKSGFKKWYVLSTGLMLLVHYTVWFVWVAQLVWLFIYQRKQMRKYLLGLLLPLATIVVNLPLLFVQIRTGMRVSNSLPVWEQLSALSLKNLILFPVKFVSGHISVDSLVIGPLVLISLGIWVYVVFSPVLINGIKKINSYRGLIWLWLIIPVILGAMLSVKIPMMSYFRFLFIIPAFHLLLMEYVCMKPKHIYLPIIYLLISVNIFFVGNYVLNKSNQREDWKSVISYIEKQNPQIPVVIIKTVSAPFEYYNKGGMHVVDYNDIDQVGYARYVWLISYAQPIFDPDNRVETTLLEKYGFELIDLKYFNGDIAVKYLYNPSGQLASY